MAYGKPEYDSITDAYRCEECGRWYRGLLRHIPLKHGISAREYKMKWGINLKEPLLGKAVLEVLRDKAYETGVYENIKNTDAFKFKRGSNVKQRYKRSEQSKRRLRLLRKLTSKKRR